MTPPKPGIDFPTTLELQNASPEGELYREFLQGMVNRMSVSYWKYGAIKQGTRSDHVANLKQRLELYEQTGNTEWLMDVANFAMIEYIDPAHPEAHFRSTDSDESPGIITPAGDRVKVGERSRV